MRKVGAVLKGARESAGISQSALAKRIGISASQLAQIESGKRVDPYFSSVARVAGALGMSLDAVATACGIAGFSSRPSKAKPLKATTVKAADQMRQAQRDLEKVLKRLDSTVVDLDRASD